MIRLPVLLAAICSAVVAIGIGSYPDVASGDGELLVPMTQVFSEVEHAHTITVCAFTLSPHGRMARALEQAAQRGASVSVVLDSKAFGDAETMNAEAAQAFAAAGIRVHQSGGATHLKAAVFDGQRIYLSDKNFASRGNELVVDDPFPGDRQLVERAMLGVPGSNDHLWLRKADALEAEARLVAYRGGPNVDVQTESFGDRQPVFTAMASRAQAGDHVRLLVYGEEFRKSPRERQAVEQLQRLGVLVRVADTNEKLAINGPRAFVGSANQTSGLPDQIDFGFYVGDPAATTQIQEHFNENWNAATDARTEGS